MQNSISALANIQDRSMSVLRSLLGEHRSVAFLDFPAHQNAGDSLIYAGELEYLKKMGIHVRYISDVYRYEKRMMDRLAPGCPILLHGGGNFGDRWPIFQDFRLRVIAENPDRAIIQLPQTIEFSSWGPASSTQHVIGQHRNLTLMFREARSMRTGQRLFGDTANVVFCPDLAFGNGPLPPVRDPDADVVVLLREDSESTGVGIDTHEFSTVRADWGLRGINSVAWDAARLPAAVSRRFRQTQRVLYPAVAFGYGVQYRLNVSAARTIIGRGRILVTDRLHAAVLGALTGVPVIALDNSNGKVSSIYSEYLHEFENVYFAPDRATAEILLQKLVESAEVSGSRTHG